MVINKNEMVDLYSYSCPELVKLLGGRFREYRLRCNLTQKDVSESTGIGLTTIHKFENGTARNISIATFFLLLKSIGMADEMNNVLRELPDSPYLDRGGEKKAQRVRHRKEQ